MCRSATTARAFKFSKQAQKVNRYRGRKAGHVGRAAPLHSECMSVSVSRADEEVARALIHVSRTMIPRALTRHGVCRSLAALFAAGRSCAALVRPRKLFRVRTVRRELTVIYDKMTRDCTVGLVGMSARRGAKTSGRRRGVRTRRALPPARKAKEALSWRVSTFGARLDQDKCWYILFRHQCSVHAARAIVNVHTFWNVSIELESAFVEFVAKRGEI